MLVTYLPKYRYQPLNGNSRSDADPPDNHEMSLKVPGSTEAGHRITGKLNQEAFRG